MTGRPCSMRSHPAGRAALVLAGLLSLVTCKGDRRHAAPPAPEPAAPPVREDPQAWHNAQVLGPLDPIPAELRPLFEAADDFAPLPEPKPGDWLAEHRERGQTYAEFTRSSPNLPSPQRDTIYLLPVGGFSDASPSLKTLADFVQLYFTLEVTVLPAVTETAVGATTRRNPFTEQKQILTHDVLRYLRKRIPADAYALIAITEVDLYPDPTWNFVFGEASLHDRVGVYSLIRYHPSFYGDRMTESAAATLVLRRSLKVMVHEIGHIFGLDHCTHYLCLMNGSNHMAESDRQPLHLCPVDLRKLYASVKFDPRERYRDLAGFYTTIGFTEEAAFVNRRLARVDAEPGPGDTSP